ncbi:hypothetical protein CVAR292_02960 [Corynebacterium variabile]|uniref:Uncharacterized protein n=1 Tax=Corynebacterium variabile TaxID=1727 RepID=A0A0X8XW64_9CORY|nr:hypothetical protein CVAR292_02960 [Corynebacterium variabile]
MALAFSSGVYFEGMGLLLCNPVPSIKPGAIQWQYLAWSRS